MKKVFLVISVALLAVPGLAKTTKPVTQDQKIEAMCREAADKAVDVYWQQVFQTAKEEAKSNLEPGDEMPDDDSIMTPWEFYEAGDDGSYTYQWSASEECAVGVVVNTKVSQDKKSCDATVDEDSYSQDCG